MWHAQWSSCDMFHGLRNTSVASGRMCFQQVTGIAVRRSENMHHITSLRVEDQFWKGLWRKDLNENHGTYWGMRAVAGVQDVHSQEAYHFIRYFHTFLKRSNLEWQDILHNLCTISDLTVDKPWNDLSRAWNDLSMAWNGLSRAWTGVPEFSTDFFFLLQQKCWIPKKKCNMWVSIWILLMAQEFKNIQF